MPRVLVLSVARCSNAGGSRPSRLPLAPLPVIAGLLAGALLFSKAALAADVASIVVHGVSPARAAVIQRHAEAVRSRIVDAILGNPSPLPWDVPCEIYVHATHAGFERAVGGPPAGAGGATAIEFAGERVASRRIDVMGNDAIPEALAHELVHVVLADRFTRGPPPQWADEGLAILFDAPAKQAGHEADFQAARRDGMIWSASHLFAMDEYPAELGRQRVFYGQSAALTRWLIERRSMASFLEFVEDSAVIGSSEALERHYGFASPEALDRAWLGAPSRVDLGVD